MEDYRCLKIKVYKATDKKICIRFFGQIICKKGIKEKPKGEGQN